MPSINPSQNYINPNTWSPTGRIGRQRFIATLLIIWVVISAIAALIVFAGGSEASVTLVSLIASIPAIFAYIKRCRDAGISPHWTWVTLIPIAAFVLFLYLCFKDSEPLSGL